MTDLIPADDLTALRALIERVGEIEVVDAASNQMASATLRDVKGMREAIEKRVTDLRRPHMKAADAISREAKPYLEELKDGEQHLRGVVTAYMVEQARMVREEEEAREARLALAETAEEVEQALVALATPVERDWRPAGVSLTSHLKIEVTDFGALVDAVRRESGMPLDLLLPNLPTLLTYARLNGREDASIPGVRVWSEQAVAASARCATSFR